MLRLRNLLPLAASAPFLFGASAGAAPLSVVNVGAPAVNCVFAVSCVITVNDSVGNFTPPTDLGVARLQSRTYDGVAPAPAGGKTGYEYRVDLTSVKGVTAENCVTKMQINFGPIVKEPYPPGPLAQVFVVTSGGLGSVGILSATQVGGVVTFNFDSPSTGGVCPGQTSYFFGLTSAHTVPVATTARLFFSLGGSALVAARRP